MSLASRLTLQFIEERCMPIPESGCLIWMGAITAKGYGQYTIGKHTRFIHRVMYALAKGPIPDGLQIDHLCRVKGCCNPAHLEAVTAWENICRTSNVFALNGAKTHCLRGHPLSGPNLHIRPQGWRRCRVCAAMHRKVFHQRRGRSMAR